MSNHKEFQSAESTKIKLEVTLQSTEPSSDLLPQDSQELANYLSDLALKNQRNPRHLCVACWCQLTYFQKQQHVSEHLNLVRTAGQYTEKESFVALATNYGHFQERNQVKHFFKIKEKPPNCMQIKKGKANQENQKSEVQMPVLVDLTKTSLKKEVIPQLIYDSPKNVSEVPENLQKKVKYSLNLS